MSTTQTLVTAAEFMEMDFEHPVELVRGEIVEIPQADQAHGIQCLNIGFALKLWIRQTGEGAASANVSAVATERDPDTVRGADVCYLAPDRLPDDGRVRRGDIDLVPTLCVEVLSPSNRKGEMRRKIDEFFARGVQEVWIVDLVRRVVEVHLLGESPRVLTEAESITSRNLPGFDCPVANVFEGV